MKYISGLLSTKTTIGVSNVSFNVKEGDVVSLVGESGSGKSTIANIILRFLTPTEGRIYFKNGYRLFVCFPISKTTVYY